MKAEDWQKATQLVCKSGGRQQWMIQVSSVASLSVNHQSGPPTVKH